MLTASVKKKNSTACSFARVRSVRLSKNLAKDGTLAKSGRMFYPIPETNLTWRRQKNSEFRNGRFVSTIHTGRSYGIRKWTWTMGIILRRMSEGDATGASENDIRLVIIIIIIIIITREPKIFVCRGSLLLVVKLVLITMDRDRRNHVQIIQLL